MSEQELELFQLGYSQAWLDYGILTEDVLKQQSAELATGEDAHTEHYRYRTLSTCIRTSESMSDDTLGKLLQLIKDDADQSMASSALILLLKQPYLTDEQFEVVSKQLTQYGDWTQREMNKQQHRRTER